MPQPATEPITRTTVWALPVSQGCQELSRTVDRMCGMIEADGNRVVSVSHTVQEFEFDTAPSWSVLVAYTKADA